MVLGIEEAGQRAAAGAAAGMPRLWERKPEESAQAFAAFETYLRLEQDRGLRAVAQRVGRHLSLMKRWSSRHGWRTRAAAWDASQRQHVVTETKAQEAAYERRLRNAEQLEKVAMAGLRSLLVRDPDTGELRFDRRLKPAEIASLIRVACQMMPTSPPAPAEDDEDGALSDLSDADLIQLQSLLQQETADDTDGEHE